MASLRSRVLASVLVLAAAGLVALAAVTYAEQRSFLEGRVDQEVKAAWPALSFQLDSKGFRPASSATQGRGGSSGAGAEPRDRGRLGGPGGGPAGGNVNLPPGTYGQRRDASGKVLGNVPIGYSESETVPPAPQIPASVPLGKLFTVGSVGSSGLRYRVYARQDPEDTGITVAAVPLREVDQTLSRLLLVEGLVIGGVLLALGLGAYFVVRLGLRPLDRIEVTAGQIAAGELSRRVSPATSRTEVGRLGLALNAMLERLERAFAERTASEERLREFLADASHELRTPLASIRGYAELFRMGATEDEAGTEMAMRRIEEESKRMGVLVEDLLTLARLDEEPELRRGPVDLARLARDAVEDARATAPERAIDLSAPTRRSPRVTATSSSRCSQTCCATRSCTRLPGPRSRCRSSRTRRRSRSGCATMDRASPTSRKSTSSAASGEPRAVASEARRAQVSGSRSRAPWSTPTAARSAHDRRPAEVPCSSCGYRSPRPRRWRPTPAEPRDRPLSKLSGPAHTRLRLRLDTASSRSTPTERCVMSLSIAIAAIVFADIAMLSMLAYTMSRAKLLTPHVSLATATVRAPAASVSHAQAAGHARPARATALPASA
jgi:two-component system OmpR family sensor kinase